MFHHHKSAKGMPSVSLPEETVRLLLSPEELQAAIERAREFERRGVDEYQRRVGACDRFVDRVDHPGAPIDSPADPAR
jgi:hypothetical protein